MNTGVPQDKSAREAIMFIASRWSEAAPGNVSAERAEELNFMLAYLLRKLEAEGFEVPDVSVHVDGEWVRFGAQEKELI